MGVVSVALAAPLLWFDYLPYLDLPQHVGTVAILAGGDASWRLHDYYEIDILGSPYILPYLLAAALAKLFGAVAAVKIMFALAAAALPWAVAYCAQKFARDPRIALLAAPVAYGTFAFLGFLNFVLSLPVWLLWLGWWRGAVDSERFGLREWATGALLSVAIFYGHVMTLGYAAGCCGVIALMAAGPIGTRWQDVGEVRRLGRRLLRGLHFAPGLLLLVAWSVLSPVAKEGELGRMIGDSNAHSPPKWAEPLDALKGLFEYAFSVYHDSSDELLLCALIGVFGLLWLVRVSPAKDGATLRDTLADQVPGALLLAALILAVAMPESYRGIWPIAARMAPFIILLALLLPRGRIAFAKTAIVAGLTLSLATAATHASHFSDFQSEVGGLDEAIEPIEPGRRTMTLVFDRDSGTVRWPAFMHYSQYVVAKKGGVAEFSFVNFTKSPVHYADLNAPPRNPVRFEWTPERFRLKAQADYWDYVLVKGNPERASGVFEGIATWPVVVRSAGWTLYERP